MLCCAAQFSESLVRLPGPFLCYTPSADAPPVSQRCGSVSTMSAEWLWCLQVSPSPAEAGGFVTFGSFNNLAKARQQHNLTLR